MSDSESLRDDSISSTPLPSLASLAAFSTRYFWAPHMVFELKTVILSSSTILAAIMAFWHVPDRPSEIEMWRTFLALSRDDLNTSTTSPK